MKRVISFVKGGGKGRGGASDVVPVRNLSFEGGLDDPPGYEVDTKTLSKLHSAAWLGQLDKLKGRAEQLFLLTAFLIGECFTFIAIEFIFK
ncbi:Hypothetical predicted protein [Cloeon dipterum]|uniref:Uncharacterized protein n=1 Tax=Cloeon dipterum TaxID=197152 RepID=A0A8S1CM24_9INSE|nr:Hypothetical predicted protein [Cloeon dipterum]